MLILPFLYFIIAVRAAAILTIASLSKEELEWLKNDPSVTQIVEFNIHQRFPGEDRDLGNLKLALFGSIVPITVKNFVELSKGTYGFGYKNSKFHRVIANFMIQGGDFLRGDGTGGYSIYNDYGKFDDENFIIGHNKDGRLSMANGGPNTNGGQFFITHSNNLGYLNGKHVVFGQLISGFDTLNAIAKTRTGQHDAPENEVYIADVEVVDFEPMNTGKYSEYIEVNEKNTFYRWLMILLVVSIVGFFIRNWYFRRQLAKDIKDNSFYHD